MFLALAIVALIITLCVTALVGMANMMSDAPSVRMLVWPWFAGGLAVSAALFAAWWFLP